MSRPVHVRALHFLTQRHAIGQIAMQNARERIKVNRYSLIKMYKKSL
jgi:hypothetical protein